jgi:hypothetical protein
MAAPAGPLRLVGLILALVLVAAACGQNDPNLQEEFEADVALIQQLWIGFSDSWSGGVGAGYAFVAGHNHPILECDAADFEAQQAGVPESLHWELVLDAASIERHDSWVLRDSTGALAVPQGRIYRHPGTATFSGDFPTETRRYESHSAILDGEAVFFFPCR